MPVHSIHLSLPNAFIRDVTKSEDLLKLNGIDMEKYSSYEDYRSELGKYKIVEVGTQDQALALDVLSTGGIPDFVGEFAERTGVPFQGKRSADEWQKQLLSALDTKDTIQDMLKVFGEVKKVLFIDPNLPSRFDHMSVSILYGLKQVLGYENVDLVNEVPYLYEDYDGKEIKTPFFKCLPSDQKCTKSVEDVQEMTRKNEYDIVVFPSFLTDKTPAIVNQVMAAGYASGKIALVINENAPLSQLMMADPHLAGVMNKFNVFVKEIDNYYEIHHKLALAASTPSDVMELMPIFTKLAGIIDSVAILGEHDKIVHAFIAAMAPDSKITIEAVDVTDLEELAAKKRILVSNEVCDVDCVVINGSNGSLQDALQRNAEMIAVVGTENDKNFEKNLADFLQEHPEFYELERNRQTVGISVLSKYGEKLDHPREGEWMREMIWVEPKSAIIVSQDAGMGSFWKTHTVDCHVIQVGKWTSEESKKMQKDVRHLVSKGKFATINGSTLHAIAKITTESKVDAIHVDLKDRTDVVFAVLAAQRVLAPGGVIIAPNKFKDILCELMPDYRARTSECNRDVAFRMDKSS
jgi:hypothetical protein